MIARRRQQSDPRRQRRGHLPLFHHYDAAISILRSSKQKNRTGDPVPSREHMTTLAVCRICLVNRARKISEFRPGRRAEWRPASARGQRHRSADHQHQRARALGRVGDGLLMSDQPPPRTTSGRPNCTCWHSLGLTKGSAVRLQVRRRGKDASSLVITVDHSACILYDRCVRICDEVKQNNVIGRTARATRRIGFDLDARGRFDVRSCGECAFRVPPTPDARQIGAESAAGRNRAPPPCPPRAHAASLFTTGIS